MLCQHMENIFASLLPSSKPVWMSLFCWTQRKVFWKMWETEQFWGTIDFHSIFFPTMEVNGAPKQPGYKLSSEYPLCSAEQRHSYRFGTTWGWVNDDRIFIFGWTIPLMSHNISSFCTIVTLLFINEILYFHSHTVCYNVAHDVNLLF